MMVAEEMHVRRAACSRLATFGPESQYRHRLAQLNAPRGLGMVVHGDDFIIAGSGDALDWLSHKLNEKLEPVQMARMGPGHDKEATVLNRCVSYRDTGLTWEADPRHAEVAVAEPWTSGGASTDEPRRRQAERTTGP